MESNSSAHSETSPGHSRRDSRLFRYISPALVLCIGIALSVSLFMITKKMGDDRIKAGFEGQAKDRFTAFKNISDTYLQELEALEAFYAASEKVTRAEFHIFTEKLLIHYERTQALEWIPRVADSERAAYETEVRREGSPNFQITERKAGGVPVKAGRRREYFPINFIEPRKGNEGSFGYDLASEPLSLEAINLARDTGQVTATACIKLMQGKGESYGVLILRPVYRKGLPADSIEARRRNLEGFVLGDFMIGDLLEEAMSSFVPAGIDVYVYDYPAQINDSFLYFHSSRARAIKASPVSGIKELTKGLHYSGTFDMAGRKCLALFIPTNEYISARKTWAAWWFFAGGILAAVLLAGYIRLITGQTAQARQYSAGLFRAKEEWEQTFDTIPDMVSIIDSQYRIIRANKAMADKLGVPKEELVGKLCYNLLHNTDEPPAHCPHHKTIIAGKEHLEEFYSENLKAYYIVSATPLFDSAGRVYSIVEIAHDISDRKRMENQIRASLEEKEVLLREIHHRVKNNMTIIYSLLDLQSKYTTERHDREMLDDAKARIKTMALIHEKLYKSRDMARIDFSDYLRDILDNMFMSYVKAPGRIALKVDVRDVALGIDDAIPCGLIINELVSNTLKHAFPEGRKGEITVSMLSYDNDMVELIVADNGVGLPDDLDARKKSSLGLSLIDGLVKQLQGEIELRKEEGTRFRITFRRHK